MNLKLLGTSAALFAVTVVSLVTATDVTTFGTAYILGMATVILTNWALDNGNSSQAEASQ